MLKGIEGLPLKYIVIILVAALVIGVVFTVISTFTSSTASGASSLDSTLNTGMDRTAQDACESFGPNCTFVNGTCSC